MKGPQFETGGWGPGGVCTVILFMKLSLTWHVPAPQPAIISFTRVSFLDRERGDRGGGDRACE